MKKKVFLVFVAIVLAVVCLAGCDGKGKALNELNDAVRASYSHVSVTVKTERDGNALNGKYEVSFDGDTATIDYSYDKLRELSLDGNNPADYTEKVEGSATAVNGQFANGSNPDLKVGELAYTKFNFKKEYLSNVNVVDKSFSATVVNPKGFVGNSQFAGSYVTVQASLDGTKLTKLAMEYVSAEGANVSMTFEFVA